MKEAMDPIDATRLNRWFEQHGDDLLLYARQWLDRTSAEDAVQEVFLRMCSARWAPANVQAWLFRSLRNLVIDWARARVSRRRHEQAAGIRRGTWFQPQPDDLIDAAAAQAALELLPLDEREIIVLRIWGGLTLAEAAEVTGQPVSTLYSRYRTGLAALRETMEATCKRTPTT